MFLNGVEENENLVRSKIKNLDEFLIVEFVAQAEYASSLFPESTNTIRIITILDPATSSHYMPIAMHRIGRQASIPTDNSHRGGISAEIDCESGELLRVAARDRAGRLAWHDSHPETGVRITGVRVPGWNYVKQEILNAAEKLSFYKFMSWDVVVTNEGFVVLEADVVSGLRSLQQHRPLLLDDRLRGFMEFHRFIRARRPDSLTECVAKSTQGRND